MNVHITPETLLQLPTSHQVPSAHNHTYPHHTRCPQHTNTPTPVTPDALSTQFHLPPAHHTRCPQHTNTPTPVTPDALSTQTHLPPSHQTPCYNYMYPHYTRAVPSACIHSYPTSHQTSGVVRVLGAPPPPPPPPPRPPLGIERLGVELSIGIGNCLFNSYDHT